MIRCLLNLTLLLGCTLSTASNSLPYFRSADLGPEWLAPNEVAQLTPISEFSLIDQHNQPVTRKDLKQRLAVVNFFFTQCPGICPTTMTQMARINRLIQQNPNVMLLSLSITPEHDSVEALSRYAAQRSLDAQNWHLLTGEPDVAQRLARDHFFADLTGQPTNGAFVHTEKVFLLDAEQHIRGVYNGTAAADMDRLAADIEALLGQ